MTVHALLDRHAARRSAGVPTVSVLAGPVGAGGRVWREWAAARGHPVVTSSGGPVALRDWLTALVRRVDLLAAAVGVLARAVGRDEAEFRAAWRVKTAADVERFWDARSPDDARFPVRELARLATGDASTSDEVVAVLAPDPFAVVDLVSPAELPALLLTPPSVCDPADWFPSVAGEAVGWATRAPFVPIAVAVPAAVWAAFAASAPESRVKAVLREGLVEADYPAPAEVARALTDTGLAAPVADAAARVLAEAGPTDALLSAAVEAARTAPAADERARSAAERFMFELLESIPETAGRFELNGTLDFRFGPRAAEIDLLDRAGGLAIEVDGYHHFRDPVAYRRDRNKDWELQRRGFVVLRFLADDVVTELEMVRDRILDAVACRRPEGPP